MIRRPVSVILPSLLVLSSFNTVVIAAPPQEGANATSLKNSVAIVPTRVYDTPENFRKEDSRLQKHVSVDKPFVYLGELLETFALQTGVEITASDSDGAAGEEFTAVLTKMQVADAMGSLSSLLTHEGVRWRWRREGDGSATRPYVYRLIRPADKVAEYPLRVKEKVQAEFEKEAEVMIAGLDMSPEELKKKAIDYPCLNYLIQGKETPLGVKAFRDCLSPAQRLQVLRNWGDGINIPLSELHPSGKQAEAYMHDEFQKLNPNSTFHVDSAYFWTTDSRHDGIPRMVIGFGELGGWGYLGGEPVKASVLKQNEKDWQHDAEQTHDPVRETGSLPPPKDQKQTPSQPGRGAMPERLQYIARQGGLSLLARLQRDDTDTYSLEPWHKPLADYLRQLESDKNLMQKWRKNSDGKSVLLLDYLDWYKQDLDAEHPSVPWNVVKQLRLEQAKNTKPSALNAVAIAAANLNQIQISRLVRGEFSLLEPVPNKIWLYGPFFAWLQANPKQYTPLLATRGVSINVLPSIAKNLVPTDQRNDLQRVRFVLAGDAEADSAWRIETLDAQGAVITTTSFPTWNPDKAPKDSTPTPKTINTPATL